MNRALVPAILLASLAACTSHASPAPTLTERSTVTRTLPAPDPAPVYRPPAPSTVAPLPLGAKPRVGEVETHCPYIASTHAQNPASNVQDIIGSHVGRTTVLTAMNPAGCRFYFYRPPYQAVADIVVKRFATSTVAYNAMILTARTGTQATGQPQMAPGVDGVTFRTRFFGPDGPRDWACAFAVKSLMIVIHTDRYDEAFSAVALAKAIAEKV